MQAEILKDIDLLAEMAGASDNVETLIAELSEIDKNSNKLKKELNAYESIIPEEKYFRASERLVDENLKASIETKIKKQQQALEEIEKELDLKLTSENELYEKKKALLENITQTKEYISALKERTNSSKNNSHYKDLLDLEEKKLTDLNSELAKNEKNYAEVSENINYLNLAKKEKQEKLDKEKIKLADTKASLVNPKSYIDYDLKKIDDAKVIEIKEKLLTLDKRRLEILTDPAMIAEETKNLILDDDRTSALSKIKELVTIAKTKPFMDVPNGSELTSLLQEELTNTSDKRDEFASIIENKDYLGGSNSIIKERIEFLESEIKSLEQEIADYENKIEKLDTDEFTKLQNVITSTTNYKEELESQIISYQDMLKMDSEDKSPKRIAVLNSALIKKQEELKIVTKILDTYMLDQKSLVLKTNDIITNIIAKLQDTIELKQTEINDLKKLDLEKNKVKDVLAIETDKRKLKELDDKVKDIINRQKYERTPSEIYDEIEIYFGTTEDDNEPDEKESTIEFIPEVEDKEPILEKYDVEEELPLYEEPTKSTTGERKKVIKVEKLEKEENDTFNDDDYIIGDYKDDDYLDIENFLNDDNGVL